MGNDEGLQGGDGDGPRGLAKGDGGGLAAWSHAALEMAETSVGWPLSPAEWREHWEWCREYIDREVVYRAGPREGGETHPPIPSKKPGGMYVWQFYLRRATYNSEFAHRLGLLFWDHFGPIYKRAPFQICACWPSGAPIGMAIVMAAYDMGVPINLFMARREPKHIGMDNWFDGHVELNLPVLMVDDAAASTEYMKVASARVQAKLRLPLHRCCFTVVNKVGFGFSKDAQHTENYLDNMLVSFFNMNNFCHTVRAFRERYGEEPKWTGIVQ